MMGVGWAVGTGGQGGDCAPYFGISVIPIPTRGADYAYNITIRPHGFSDLPTALNWMGREPKKKKKKMQTLECTVH